MQERARPSLARLCQISRRMKVRRPIFISRAEGARLYDYDGNEYIDYSLSMGPAVLGRQNKNIQRAIADAANLFHSNEMTMIQIEAAEKIKQLIPSAELVRFVNTGTEANTNNLRIARAYTNKNMYIKFSGQYNGGSDCILGGMPDKGTLPIARDEVDNEDGYSVICSTTGRASHALDDCYIIEWNDLDAMKKLFEKDW